MTDRCKRCGHPLKDAVSQARGYGPVCFKKVKDLPPEPALTVGQHRLKEFLQQSIAQFCCERCGEPTPVLELKRGLCPRCREVPAKLEELDAILQEAR